MEVIELDLSEEESVGDDSVVILDEDDDLEEDVSVGEDSNYSIAQQQAEEDELLSFDWRGNKRMRTAVPLPPPPTKQPTRKQASLLKKHNTKMDVAIRTGKYKHLELAIHCSGAFCQTPIFPVVEHLLRENERVGNLSSERTMDIEGLEVVWFRRHELQRGGDRGVEEGVTPGMVSTMERTALVFLSGKVLCDALGRVGGPGNVCQKLTSCRTKLGLDTTLLLVVLDCNKALSKLKTVVREDVDRFLTVTLGMDCGIAYQHVRTEVDAAHVVWNHYCALESWPYKKGSSGDSDLLDLMPKSKVAADAGNVWHHQLQCVRGLSASKADTLMESFASCAILYDAIQDDVAATELKLQHAITAGRRELKMARVLTLLFTSCDANERI